MFFSVVYLFLSSFDTVFPDFSWVSRLAKSNKPITLVLSLEEAMVKTDSLKGFIFYDLSIKWSEKMFVLVQIQWCLLKHNYNQPSAKSATATALSQHAVHSQFNHNEQPPISCPHTALAGLTKKCRVTKSQGITLLAAIKIGLNISGILVTINLTQGENVAYWKTGTINLQQSQQKQIICLNTLFAVNSITKSSPQFCAIRKAVELAKNLRYTLRSSGLPGWEAYFTTDLLSN